MQLSDLSQPPIAALSKLVGLLALPNLTDVVCNGPNLWFADVGLGLRWLPNLSVSSAELLAIARTLIDLGDRHLDIANPIADVSLRPSDLAADGASAAGLGALFESLVASGVERIRVHAVLESAVSPSTLISIRVHRSGVRDLDDLAASGGWTPSQLEAIRALARKRTNLLVTGPAGSGKTTLFRAILLEQPALRTIVVEDTAELLPCGPATVGLQVREPNQDGAGHLPMRELTRHALRMRPDRIVVGEVRGGEVLDLLNAMSTGHAGSGGTLHANSGQAVRRRLAGLLHEAGVQGQTADALIAEAVQAVVHLRPDRSIEFVGELP
jgi:pilus assembly protein CpaF